MVQCETRERRQHHLTRFRALAGKVKPQLTACTGLDTAQRDANEFARAQTGRIAEIEQEAQALRNRNCPAMRPFEPVGNGPHEFPLAGGKGA